MDVIGIDLKDIIHPQDFMDVAAIFQSQGHDVGPDIEALLGNNHRRRNFVARMRCAFTPSVRSVTRCSNFKVNSKVILYVINIMINIMINTV